ncbi:hypothetical protein LguiB_027367 [Lonicera macranthoides]
METALLGPSLALRLSRNKSTRAFLTYSLAPLPNGPHLNPHMGNSFHSLRRSTLQLLLAHANAQHGPRILKAPFSISFKALAESGLLLGWLDHWPNLHKLMVKDSGLRHLEHQSSELLLAPGAGLKPPSPPGSALDDDTYACSTAGIDHETSTKGKLIASYMSFTCLIFNSGGTGDNTAVKFIRCKDNERQALLNFKKEITLDKGGLLSSWGSQEEDCCKWRGIRCSNTTAHVILLDLHGWFDDRATEFIGSLSKLQHLNLSDNLFVGRVPHQLGNLTNLRSFDLGSNNDLTVEKLEWLSDLRLLQHLDLSTIDLQKVDLLQSIDRLSFLSSLHLRFCNLPGIISPSLHFTNFSSIHLSIIQLSCNSFTDSSSYNWLFNFSSSLVDVKMSYNPLGGSIPDAFGNMMSLESLHLSNCALEGEIPKSFKNLSRIQSLDLTSNNLIGQLPELFQTLFASKNSLQILELSQNKFSGSLSNSDFTSFSSLSQSSTLEYLDLSENELNGSLPDLTSFPLLRGLYLTNNKIQGRLPESIGELSNLKELDLSFNLLALEFSSNWTPRFQLDVIKLSSCMLGPHFPKWLRSQSNFSFLDISSAGISDTIPHWFWDLSPKLVYLNFSDNQIHGMLPDLSLKFVKLDNIDLSSNRFKGPIPLFPRNLTSLNLSKNMFSGSIISLCTIMSDFLNFLDFSDNLLSGEVPDCWIKGSKLGFLDLSNNNLSQKIPASFGFLDQLLLLNLHNNSFIGELPSSLKNCSILEVVDTSENKLSGQLSAWIGTDLTHLSFLSFRKNEFNGSIPPSMCLLNNTQVLDLSQNKISGIIPQCFDKLYSLIQTESSRKPTDFKIPIMSRKNYYELYMLSALVQWKGKLLEYKSTLRLLKCIDLSSNKLVGQIPQELASLGGLCSLNLSRNNLTGHIIQNISQMKNLEILDLSRNQLSGAIPIDLGSLNFLSVLDLSSNNFSGKIPLSTQLQTFNASVYAGNDKLCGIPLNECPKDESTSVCPSTYTNEEDEDTFVTMGLYVSAVLGFATGFWGLFGSLMLRSSWRYAYLKLLDKIQDWIYVMIAVNTARVQRKKNLFGPAIQNISVMKTLEILDLSRNQLSGSIPIGLASLHFLNVLDTSSNNLSGKIPRSTQLDTFNTSVYAGNNKLCGLPLPLCLEDESTSFPPPNNHGKAEDTFVTTRFYVSVVLGFAIEFSGFIAPLVLQSSWRYAYFKILDNIQDCIYATIVVNMARMQRKFMR